MTPQSKRKKAPESPQRASNKKSKQSEAPVDLGNAPKDGNSAWPPLPSPSSDPVLEISQFDAWLQTVLQSLRNECIAKSPYFKRAPDLPVIRPGIGSRTRKRMDEYNAKHPGAFQQLMDQLNNIDESKLPPPLSPRAVDARLRRMGIKITEEVAVPNVNSLKVALLRDPQLVGQLARVSSLEMNRAEPKESVARQKQAFFDQLVEVALAKERATHGNNQSTGE